MCHGIIREYAKKYDKVGIFSLERNYPTVIFMFRDLNNVEVIKGTDVDAKKYIKEKTKTFGTTAYDEVLLLGFENLNRNSGVKLETQFYGLADVPLRLKWDNFIINRDQEKEAVTYDQYAPKEPYIFLHEDTIRQYIINRKLINDKYKVFIPSPEMSLNAFDFCKIIENASEIHVIDSSFMFLIDCLPYSNPDQRLFVHRYSRENEDWKLPTLGKNWKVYWMSNHYFGLLTYLRKRLTEYKGRIRTKLFPIKRKDVVIA